MKTVKKMMFLFVVAVSAGLAQATVNGLHSPEKIDTTLFNLDQNTKPISSTIVDYVERFKQVCQE